ncbi:MAG: hypothetical protein ABIQ95_10605, partial [Bdellovibrionia bacterium]
NPAIRLPASGGACEIPVHSKRLLVIMRMSPKSFVEKCDFVTRPGTPQEKILGLLREKLDPQKLYL